MCRTGNNDPGIRMSMRGFLLYRCIPNGDASRDSVPHQCGWRDMYSYRPRGHLLDSDTRPFRTMQVRPGQDGAA